MGRFKIVENPEDADLLILMHHYHQYESSSDALLIFSGHHCAAGLPMPLWMSTAHEYTFQWHGSSFPFQGDLVLRLRQDIEQTEADRHSTASSLIRH